ncbi:MAG: carbohydrate transporter [Monoraphidium minutum]|nr:MAG: carbohydrate transporter [Monoraphidium minutum]
MLLRPCRAGLADARGARPGPRGLAAGSGSRQHLIGAARARRTGLPTTIWRPALPPAGDGEPSGTRVTDGEDPNLSGYSVESNGASAGALSAESPPGSNASPVANQAIPHRWRLVAMMSVAFVLCNMDKVNMSVAVIPMARDLGWSATDRGLVSSSFFWGYSLTQVPAGWISTRIGGAKVLMAGVALWSFGTLIAPPAAHLGLWALCASRVLVGLGEGFAPSAATSVLARQVPSTERSRAVTTVWGGLDIGSAVGLLLSGPLIRMYGWPSVFYLFAVLGGVWCLFWPMFKPEMEDTAVKQQQQQQQQQQREQQQKQQQQKQQHKTEPVPWGAFLSSAPVWAVTVAHFCFNWGYYTLLAWLPSYFELALGLNVQESSFLTLIPYVAMVAMTPVVGPVADGLIKRGWRLTSVRKLAQGIAFVGPALCMVACAALTPAAPGAAAGTQTVLLVGLLSLGFALGAWSRAGLYCNHQDLSPKYASALLGITNTAGALPGVLGVTSAGYLLDATGSWALALFFPTAACQLFGAVFYSMFASSERQSWS